MTTDEFDARDYAIDTLASTKAAIDYLNEVVAEMHQNDDDGSRVPHGTKLARKAGKARETIRFAIKFAEVNALVAISDRLDLVIDHLADLSAEEEIDEPGPIPGVRGRPLSPENLHLIKGDES